MRGWRDEERPLVTPSTHCCRWGQSHPLLLAFLIVVRYDSSWVAGTRLSSSMRIKAAHCRQEPTDSLSWCKGDGTRVFSREVQEPPVQDEGEEVVSSPSPVWLVVSHFSVTTLKSEERVLPSLCLIMPKANAPEFRKRLFCLFSSCLSHPLSRRTCSSESVFHNENAG